MAIWNPKTKKWEDDEPIWNPKTKKWEGATSSKDNSEKDTWFKSGSFKKENYEKLNFTDKIWQGLADTTNTVAGTVADIGVGVVKGAFSTVEGVADLLGYGVAGVSDVLGADKFADEIRKQAQRNDADALLGGVQDFIAPSSLLGERARGIPEALGNVASILLTGGAGQAAGLGKMGVTALTTGVTGASSMGGGMSEAYEQGASDIDAVTYGFIKGAGDAGTELLFGGLGKGVNAVGLSSSALALDDALAQKVSSKITNQIAKNFVEFGIKAGAEGTEEVLAGVVSAFGKKATYMEDEELLQLLEDERLLDQFIAGAVTSGIAQSGYVPGMKQGSLREANKAGRDFITGLSTNEQKVIDKEVENRIAEQEKDGKKLSNKEKSAIREEVQEQLEKGYIGIDTIEKTLGGQTYSVYDSLVKEADEYQKLNGMRAMELTGEQSDRLAELKEKNKANSYENQIAEAKRKLSEEVDTATQNDVYLRESYNERNRRSQAFELGETQYKTEAANKTMQNAVGKMNNTRRAHEFVERLAQISEDKGMVFDFSDSQKIAELGYAVEGKTVNGYIQGKNVTLNINSAQALNKVVGHEITHFLEGTEHYDALQQAMEEYVNLKGEGEYAKRLAEITERYKGVKDADAKKELLADLVGEYLFTDEKFVRHLSSKNRNVFQKIYDEIKYLAKTFKGTKEAKQLEKVKKVFEEAYKETSQNKASDNVQYSLAGVDKNGIEVYETSQETKGLSYKERKAKLLDLMKNEYAGRTAKFSRNGQVYYAQYDEQGVRKGTYGDKKSSPKGYKAKINIGADGNYIELAENAIYKGTSVEQGKSNRFHSDAKSWDYYVKTIQSDGVYFDVLINVKDTGNSQYVYDITLKEADSLPNSQGFYTGSSPASNSSIPKTQKNATENSKKSLSDNAIAPEPAGTWNVRGEDIALEELGPVAEGIAPAQTEGGKKAEVAPVQQSEEELFQMDELTPEDEEENRLRESDERKIKNIQAKIQGFQVSRDASAEQFDESIAKKQKEYDSLKRKDTVKASKLLTQINDLKARKENALEEINRRIRNHREAIKRIEDQATARRRKSVQNVQRERMRMLMGDTSTWKDKKVGLSYQVNTLRRNLRDIVRDADGNRDIAKADAICDELQGKYNQHEAEKNREANRIKQVYADMKINAAEDAYIQMLGEYKYNPDTTISSEVIREYYEAHKDKIDTKKVDKAIESARTLYDSLFYRLNSLLREQGMKELGYREGYFPHFTEDKQGWIAKLFNWKTQNNDIPTDIAGLTEQFNPERSYQSFSKHRVGDSTDYSFKKGMDTYVQGALDWIYHIEDIQKRRAFENEIRYQHSDKGIKEQVDEVHNNPFLDADQMQEEIDRIYKNAKNPLNNFVTDFRTGTNTLAGKKSSLDRGMEQATNRQIYSTMTNLSNRVTGNMVAGSISSALTNFIPITQSWGEVSPVSSLKAMKDTIVSFARDDGVIDKSTFLTNRLKKNENLYKSGWDKVSEKVGMLMEGIDSFTSQVVWRSKYAENLQAGMNEQDAIKNADQFAENVIAGRSRGNMPTVFDAKNPLAKMLTAFQLEVNNQYGYMFKDLPQDVGSEAKGKLLKGYAGMFIGAWAYNALYSSLVGRDAAFDPIGIIEDLLKDLGVFDDDEDEEKDPLQAVGNFAENVVGEIPFVGGLFGGGRVPINSAIPYDDPVSLVTGTVTDIADGNWTNATNEWMKPIYYLAMPMGGGQLKKTVQGLTMFDEDLPIAGSYTTSGKLRYSVDDTFVNRMQAAVFGQYANKNAREYFHEGRAPLSEKKTQELVELDIPISEYWDIQNKLKGKDKIEEKAEVIADLDLPIAKKNILINNATDREEPIDLTDYDLYADFEEFDFATKNPEKYLVSKVTGGYQKYTSYMTGLKDIEGDKDKLGRTISGSRKQKVFEYIKALDATYEEKIILFKSQYPSETRYNHQIINYIRQSSLSTEDKKVLLKELGFTITEDGKVRW